MTPLDFPEANVRLTAPSGMTEAECGTLCAYRDGTHRISCWRPSLSDRIRILFGLKVWLWVWSAHTQPPGCLETKDPWAALRPGLVGRFKRWRIRRAASRDVRSAVREAIDETMGIGHP